MDVASQYSAARAAIASNLEAIQILLAQANNLNQVVINLDNQIDADEKKKLNDSMSNVYKSIDLLVIQTGALFDAFMAYANAREAAGV